MKIDRDEIRALVVEEVRAELSAALRALFARAIEGAPPAYTTRRSGPRPDDIGLRAWQRIAPTVAGAVRRGRYVVVSREAWAVHERGGSQAIAASTAANDKAEAWSPSAALASVGLRGSR